MVPGKLLYQPDGKYSYYAVPSAKAAAAARSRLMRSALWTSDSLFLWLDRDLLRPVLADRSAALPRRSVVRSRRSCRRIRCRRRERGRGLRLFSLEAHRLVNETFPVFVMRVRRCHVDAAIA